eukprot:TRINITY_DN8058_c0_g1_i1.p2 TRINITY_DN8058_c0_g1~~TRINITY_DN8058_c0_g1_i1.p2  ORF type:complete len:55 (+),score=12.80 TRINITY_DN8058_c0_g1_i1:318-482(+)
MRNASVNTERPLTKAQRRKKRREEKAAALRKEAEEQAEIWRIFERRKSELLTVY